MKSSEVLVEVKPNIFLSKHDPGYLRKYLHYRPYDADKWVEYANEAMSSGDHKAYKARLKKAAQLGHLGAMRAIRPSSVPIITSNKERAVPSFIWYIVLLCLLFLIGFLLTYFILHHTLYQEVAIEQHYYEQNVFHRPTLPIETPASPTQGELALATVQTALSSYQKDHGTYPSFIKDLIQDYPNNYLSVAPATFSYSKAGDNITLGLSSASVKKAIPTLILVFYPEGNQLSVETSDGNTMAVYPVGSGPPLPFQEGYVQGRIVKPNGGDGVYGTRGLVLQHNIAIHGTNEPTSIGLKESNGCIRMFNEDIERIYKYIPLGTPFIVRHESPDPPVFQNGLPPYPAHTLLKSADEESSQSFMWRH
ncbi:MULTISPECIES: L,D-transpeptidase [Pontibacillus]|uniref:L,D-transpeptidase n=1 Tax=Pontibacillus chungwhensis TaxID=265426 RepID=A0ABY8UY00_9BACI|nr:L,D-transpeptidase [Pontibacillus chungwhensis]MCD5325583.1 L,D-transpeptidase [Pontibacillus sp. HN14]WIF98168.1 L,D-transpeptidase [Pontibacillus chungwhensis]